MAYKVFTNGSVLQASEINDNLMRQSVMVFSNAAARTAAITTPVEGMLTYLEDVDRYEHWNSSAWISPFGLTRIASQTFSGVSSVSLNNVFSSAYRDYFIVFSGNSNVAADLRMRLRVGGADSTANAYNSGSVIIGSVPGVSRTYAGAANFSRVGVTEIYRTLLSLFISDPFNTVTTTHNSQNTAFGNSDYFDSSWGLHSVGTSYDGITFFPSSGTFSGTIKVYGYRN